MIGFTALTVRSQVGEIKWWTSNNGSPAAKFLSDLGDEGLVPIVETSIWTA